MKLVACALAVAIAGCRPAAPRYPAFPDAPLELGDEADRDQAIDQLWTLAADRRDTLRTQVASALGRRIDDALEEDKPFVAQELLFQLASLWQPDPGDFAAQGGEFAPLLERLRATFAKSGQAEPVIAALVMLAEADPAHRTARMAELDEVLGFTDELAAAEDGPNSQRAQPIAALQPTVLVLPLPWLVDRYVQLLEDRQRAVAKLLLGHGASIELVRAHQDILATGHRIANVLVRAGRVRELSRHLQSDGIGYDRELSLRAQLVIEHPSADAYVQLAKSLRGDTHAADRDASLAVCLAGLHLFPGDPALLADAADDSASLGRIDQPIQLYEGALEREGEADGVLALKLGRLYAQRIARLAYGGRPDAATTAWHDLRDFTAHAAKWAPPDVWAQVAASGETALGKGLVSQGRIDEGEQALVAALDRAPTIDAYEALVTLDYKTARFEDATRYAKAGLDLLGNTTGDRYRRAKLERLAGDTARAAGRTNEAAQRYLASLQAWDSLGDDHNLPRAIVAERKLEAGRDVWMLGRADDAVNLVLKGVDVDPDSPALCSDAVALLLELGRYQDALDAYRHGLGSPEIGEMYKVYMSLWIVAEARRRGVAHDRLAYDYLATRHGDLWYELLAEAATGRRDLAALTAAATTAPRRIELAFYGTVLGIDPQAQTRDGARKKLEEVLAGRMVMDAEFDLARMYLR